VSSLLYLYRSLLCRLAGASKDVDVWQQILRVRSLAGETEQDISSKIKLSSLASLSGRLDLAAEILSSLVTVNENESGIQVIKRFFWSQKNI
jgi:hypothetical protein